ncbi:hypothetical protein FHX42_002707 [Saccharopolyspora lacisalsi]|uniref:Uncharacterized protein n=1 Tax=Halosaccharopolyspora lacisalsi TaxID=1000566 RepID=A0A839DYR1_9PSEU|nr:hypothetical protein [Halosaccharopolyspora lacisalsi]MBA8825356.1 hypothetical protein [Halosaccharopolyspora lacisalsi]
MPTHVESSFARSMRPRLPAVVVAALLGAVSAFLVGVSVFVDTPAPSTAPGSGIATAVTPTRATR